MRMEGFMKNHVNKKEDIKIGLLMQDTLESFFEYEDCINPSDKYKQNIKHKLEKLIDVMKKTNNQYLPEIESLRHELD